MEVMKMKKVFILLILLAFASPAYAVTAYKWVDKEGVVNFTDDYSNVPSEYSDQISTEVMEESPSVGVPTSRQTTPPRIEEAKTDIYGLGENWWRDKVSPWRERLKEATANYEKARRSFMDSAEELSQKRYGSPTQYKTNIIELDGLRVEMMKYEAQMTEAQEMLGKLSKEAEEAKADPTWLN
jgi:hypothetical protein